MKVAVCLLLVASLACAEEITVKGEKGAIKGVRIDHDFGQYFYAFRGIRYAKAPVGKLRFKVRKIQSNLAIRNFLVTLKLFLNAKSSLSQTLNQSTI